MMTDTLTFSSAEIERLRNETPGTRHCVHLNNAGASPHYYNTDDEIDQTLDVVATALCSGGISHR